MTTAWTIPEPWLSWAVGFALDQGHHVTRERFVLIADQFRDYHLQRGQPSRDWLASWRTWIRRENFERLAAGGPTESERRSSFMDRAK